MGRKIFYSELGEIEKVCYREGCYWKTNGKCGNNRELKKIGKECHKEAEEKCEKRIEERRENGERGSDNKIKRRFKR